MSNQYTEILKQAGLISGVRRGWHDATPSQRLVIGIGGVGGTISAANLSNSAANTIQTKRRADLEEKSLKALQKINSTLQKQVKAS